MQKDDVTQSLSPAAPPADDIGVGAGGTRLPDHFAGRRRQLGAHRFHVADDFRPGLLRRRDDASRRLPL